MVGGTAVIIHPERLARYQGTPRAQYVYSTEEASGFSGSGVTLRITSGLSLCTPQPCPQGQR